MVIANLMAMLVQYQSAKVGVVTGRDLPELCREMYSRRVAIALWLQAEAVAMATDLAEFVGAAVGLYLLFGMPLLPAGLVTAVVAFVILTLEQHGHRRFELVIVGLLGLVLLGFAWDLIAVGASGRHLAGGLVPHFGAPRRHRAGRRHRRRDGDAARRLPALGADQASGRVPRRRRASRPAALSSAST